MTNKDRSIKNIGRDQSFFRHNYIEYVQNLIPDYHHQTYYDVYGDDVDNAYKVLGSILLLATNATELFSVSDTALNSNFLASSYYPYFVPSNKKNTITSDSFYKDILRPLNIKYSDFNTETEFRNHLVSAVLPHIHTNTPTTTFVNGVSSIVLSSVADSSSCHNYLSDKLGILYFLNTSGNALTTDPSSFVASALAGFSFSGTSFDESDAIGTLYDYIWTNREDSSALSLQLPPEYRVASSTISGSTYTSGTQIIDGLKTLISVFYKGDENASLIKDSLDLLVQGGGVPNRKTIGGPYFKFLQAVSYAFYDLRETINDVQDLLDIEKCPPEFINYLASYIGWKLISDDIDSWRSQLRQAIFIYKSKGTRKSLESAIKLVFPAGIYDPTDSVSGLVESWESYLPFMIYYFLSTESYISRSKDPISEIKDYFNRSSNFGDNIHANINPNNLDDSIRFVVDSILERLDSKFKFIVLNGKHYKETEFWTRQTSNPHYFHRGTKVFVPPWEIQRFYEHIHIREELLEELEKILIGDKVKGGFEVSSSYVSEFLSFVRGTMETTTQTELPLGFGDNGRFKIFVRNNQQPPNYQQVLDRGDSSQVSLFDYYNSKSSHIFVTLSATNFDFTYKDFQGLGDSAVNIIGDLFFRFAPMHVALKMYLLSEFDDEHEKGDFFCAVADNGLNDYNDNVANSYSLSGFVFAAGAGLSSVFLTTKDGRVIPNTSGEFVGNLGRSAFRRRNLRNYYPSPLAIRSGDSPPLGFSQYSLSAIKDAVLFSSTDWIPLGYNFSSQTFNNISGDGSAVWDVSNDVSIGRAWITDLSTVYLDAPVSSTYPIRGISDLDSTCSSNPMLRFQSLQPITQVITNVLINKATDRNDLDFSPSTYDNFEFGEGIHRLYHAYNNVFSSLNKVTDPAGQAYNPFDGGYNIISHTFGPIVENGTLDHSGLYSDPNVSSIALDSLNNIFTVASANEIKFVAAPIKVVENGGSYLASGGSSIPISYGTLSNRAFNSYQNDLDKSTNKYSTQGVLSAIEISCDNVDSFAVWNKEDSVYRSALANEFANSLSIYKYGNQGPSNGVVIRYPLDRFRNRILNGTFKYPVFGPALNNPETSSVAHWSLRDRLSNSTLDGSASISSIEVGHGFRASAILLEGSGVSKVKAITTRVGNSPSDFNNIQPLDPGRMYELSFSAGNTAGGSLTIQLVNLAQSATYNFTTKTWETGLTTSAVLSSLAANAWTHYSYDVSTPVTYSTRDGYALLYSLSAGAFTSGVYFSNVKLLPKDGNTFERNSQYEIEITANFNRDKLISQTSNILQVRVITDITPHIGYGNTSNVWGYNYLTRAWEIASENHWKDIDVTEDITKGYLDFETIGNIHTNDQSYFIELRVKNSIGSYTNPSYITVYNMSVVNKKYRQYVQNYERNDIKTVFDYFDTAIVGSHSRNSAYTSSYGVSGGSRQAYLDLAVSGGLGVSGTFNLKDNDY